MKTAIEWTKLTLWALTAAVIAWDIVLAVAFPGATISEVGGLGWSYAHSTIPLGWGVLTGHLLWHARRRQSYRLLRIAGLSAIGLVALVLDVIDCYDAVPIVPAASGVPLGRLLWAQVTDRPLFRWRDKELGK